MSSEPVDLKTAAAKGVALCREGDWDRGLQLLSGAAEQREGTELPGLVYAFLGYGVARYQRRIRDGIKLCEHAVKIQYYEPENHLHLARTRLLAGDRRAAVTSIARGLKLDSNHRGLRELREEIGVRRRPVLRFLSRDNFLNILLGRIRHSMAGRD